MKKIIDFIRKNSYTALLVAFFCMMAPAIPLYLTAQNGMTGWQWFLLGWVISGNILVLLVRN